MKYLFFLIIFTINNFAMAQKPTMQVWTDAWHNANTEAFKNVYANGAFIFPPGKPAVQGNDKILEFMKGGLGKVDVFFEAEKSVISDSLAFEYGIFRDVELQSEKVTGEGKYSVTWILENAVWKILCHTWSMPVKY
jgi:ketosteroid isomerase-like protein